MKSTVRAFVAIDISLDVRRVAKKKLAPLQREFPDVKWVDDGNFHVTLKFLGPNVPVVELHKLIAALKRACRNVEQFDLVLEGLGAFPDATNPRTIWIGVTDGVDELSDLASRIDLEFEKLGYPPEGRAFSPHLTIARARRRDREESPIRVAQNDDRQGDVSTLADRIDDFADFYWGCCPVDRVVLYSSELERNGAKYEPLATVDLALIGASSEDEDDLVEEAPVKKPPFDKAKKLELERDRDKLRFTPRPPRNAKSNVRSTGKKNQNPPRDRKQTRNDDLPDLGELDAENLERMFGSEIEDAE